MHRGVVGQAHGLGADPLQYLHAYKTTHTHPQTQTHARTHARTHTHTHTHTHASPPALRA